MSRIGRLADAFTEWGSAAADFLFPRLCAGCFDRVADRPGLLCETCEGRIQPLATPVCPVCGQGNAPILPGGSGGACPSCPDPPLFLDAARAFTAYRGVAETVVHKLKYSHVEGHVPFMASRMAGSRASRIRGRGVHGGRGGSASPRARARAGFQPVAAAGTGHGEAAGPTRGGRVATAHPAHPKPDQTPALRAGRQYP